MEVVLFILFLLGLGNYISNKFGSPEEFQRHAGYARDLADKISQHSDEKDPEVAKQKGLEEFEKEHENDPEFEKDKEKFENGLEKEVLSTDPKDLDKVKEDLNKVETITNNGVTVDEKGNVQLSEDTKKIVVENSNELSEENQKTVDKLVNGQMTLTEINQNVKEVLSEYPNLNAPTETLGSENKEVETEQSKAKYEITDDSYFGDAEAPDEEKAERRKVFDYIHQESKQYQNKENLQPAEAVDFYNRHRRMNKIGQMQPTFDGLGSKFERLNLTEFETEENSWSSSLHLMLKSKGVELRPEIIRANTTGKSVFEAADLVSKTLPNTALQTETLKQSEEFSKKPTEEKQKVYADKLRKVLEQGIDYEKSPVSIKMNGITYTVTGSDKFVINFQNPVEKMYQGKHSEGEALSNVSMNIDQMAYAMAEQNEPVEFSYLVDLHPSKEGECPRLQDISFNQFVCEGNVVKENPEKPNNVINSTEQHGTIQNGKVATKTENIEGLISEQKSYIPNSLEKELSINDFLENENLLLEEAERIYEEKATETKNTSEINETNENKEEEDEKEVVEEQISQETKEEVQEEKQEKPEKKEETPEKQEETPEINEENKEVTPENKEEEKQEEEKKEEEKQEKEINEEPVEKKPSVEKESTNFKKEMEAQTEELQKAKEEKFVEEKLKTNKEASGLLQEAKIKSIGYIPQGSKIPSEIQNNGNFNDLMNYFNSVKDDPNYSVDEKNYLISRCWGARAIDFYDNNRKFAKLGKVEPVTSGDRISFPDLKISDFQKGNQCWSYAYSLLLKSRGVDLKPEYIRSFRPGLGKEDSKKMTEINPKDSSFLNRDEPGDPFEVADLVSKTLPNTGMVQETFNYSSEFMKMTPEEKKAEFKQNMLRVLNQALKVDKSPVAMNLDGHIVTVTGMEGDKLLIQDSLQKNHQVRNIQGKLLVNGKPGSTTTKSIDKLADSYSKSGRKFGFTWLVDIEPTKEGKCDEVSKITNGSFSCENNVIKDNRGFDKELMESYENATSTIRNGQVAFNQINSKGLSIQQRVYLPKSLEKPFVVKEYLQEKEEKKNEKLKGKENNLVKKEPEKGDEMSR